MFELRVRYWSFILDVCLLLARATRAMYKLADDLCGKAARHASQSTGAIVPPANYSDIERMVEQMW